MSESYIAAALRKLVVQRASRRCEYCLIFEDDAFLGCQVDHIISEKHGGSTTEDNLAFACCYCNRHKGSDIAAHDDEGLLVRLFNPRVDVWSDHFAFRRTHIDGISSIGQATAKLLRFNEPARTLERRAMTDS